MLEIKNINVSFYSKDVLKNVSLAFEEGKIHALFGENGAGKSTLASVLCGDLIPSSGEIFIDKKKVIFNMPKDAIKHGICCVHQRPLLADSISIKENILLGAPKLLDSKIQNILHNFLPQKKLSTLVKNLTGAERFFVSLTGTILKNPKYLILDEPTILLNKEQRNLLFSELQKLSNKGITIIVITHNAKDILEFTDTTTFINEGIISQAFVQSKSLSNLSSFEVTIKDEPSNNKQKDNSRFSIHYKNITSKPINKPSIFDVSFTAQSNEITLIKGVKESGLETLEDAITGMATNNVLGTITINNSKEQFILKKENKKLLPNILRNGKYNFAIIPSNKTYRASNPNLTVLQLVCCYKTHLKEKELIEYTNNIINRAKINAKHNQIVKTLSGGMLQRLILERELDTNPKILILCESLQGLDKDSTYNFCKRIQEHSKNNNIVVALHNSDFPQEFCGAIYQLESGFCKKIT